MQHLKDSVLIVGLHTHTQTRTHWHIRTDTYPFFWLTFLVAMSRPWESSDGLQLRGASLPGLHAWTALCLRVRDFGVCMRVLCSCMISHVFSLWPAMIYMWMCSCMTDVCVWTFIGCMYMCAVCYQITPVQFLGPMKGFKSAECQMMSSNYLPLWAVLTNRDFSISIIFQWLNTQSGADLIIRRVTHSTSWATASQH